MRYFLDTEFIENGRTIDLISIGIVSEDDREFYAENSEVDLSSANLWVKQNVLPKLTGDSKSREEIRKDLLSWIGDDQSPVFFGYFADYDWVVFCQLFGTMIDLPQHFPMYCRDIKQIADESNVDLSTWNQDTTEHNALVDAHWNHRAFKFLEEGKK